MPGLGPEYFSYLRNSLKTALNSATSTAARNHRLRRDTSVSPPLSSTSSIISANKAITFHCQIGETKLARHIFDEMPQRTVVSWNAMITGYSNSNMFSEALSLISSMHRSGVKLNETTLSVALSVCGRTRLFGAGKKLHGLVIKSEHGRFEFVGSGLVYAYSNCCEIGAAQKVFDELHQENELLWSLMLAGYIECGFMSQALSFFSRMPWHGVVEWTTLIAGYVKHGGCKKALEMFNVMRKGVEATPNEYTLDCVLRACGQLGYLLSGRAIHGLIMKLGFQHDRSIGGALILLYCECELTDDAARVYQGMESPGLSDSNELIRGMAKAGKLDKAESIFRSMAEKNSASYDVMIKAYAMWNRVKDAERLFQLMPNKVPATFNTMISVYARNGDIEKALKLFTEVKDSRRADSWNSMISGYVHNKQYEDALKLYLAMQRASINRTKSTFSALFRACASLGSLEQGELLHTHLEKTPFSSNVYAGTSLLDMYSKCRSISAARTAFTSITYPNVAAWTALISAYAHHSLALNALSTFNLMLEQDMLPNAATFVAILSACARAGFVEKGMKYFQLMKDCYGVAPTIEHFTCVVDLLGRAGFVREAEEFIKIMPVEVDKAVLISLLHASWSWLDMKVGERVAEATLALDTNPASASVIMSNMYSTLGKWGQKMKARNILKEVGVSKDPGCSWINVNNRTHIFSADCRSCQNFVYSQVTGNCMPNLNKYSFD